MLNKKVKSIPLNNIKIQDSFWKSYMELVRNQVIPYQWEAINDRIKDAKPSYCMENFQIAAGLKKGGFKGMVFQDSDVYKWLEAVAYSLMQHPDESLEKTADSAIDLIRAAQQDDGYLDTYYIINGLDKRFTNLMDHHELYCMGHMVEAAVAYYKATGKAEFLNTAIGFVNCVNDNLGKEDGKLKGYPGHEVAEMALIALYEVTKDEKHLKLAKYFVDQRGQEPLYFAEECEKNKNTCHWNDSYFKMQYYQAGRPVRKQERAEGHAVRAVYLYSGMADAASHTQDEELFNSCERLWNSIAEKQMYITGGIGSSQYGEAFTFDYDLPNDTVYAETCASIGLIFFAKRMFEITKDSRYTNVLERALYNGVISGMSLDGRAFFYVNPLEVIPEASEKDYNKKHVKPQRQKWFGCACCPPNIARLLSSIGEYAYEQNDNEVFINLFIGGEINIQTGRENQQLTIETQYPWNGNVKIHIKSSVEASFTYAVRIPDWCGKYKLTVNGGKADYSLQKGYAYLTRIWKAGDVIELDMDMPVVRIEANPRIRDDAGKTAVMRGPVVYCLEEADNGSQLHNLYLSDTPNFKADYHGNLLNGVVTISAAGKRLLDEGWENTLYRPVAQQNFERVVLKFIPYYAWANRTAGEMCVWVRRERL